MNRREFITLLGGAAAAWPLAARAQRPSMPIVGVLSSSSQDRHFGVFWPALREGLNETGWIEGQNVAIEHRWADGQYDKLPALASELVHLQVAVLIAAPLPSALAAKSATTRIPIVFTSGGDAVKYGLVASLNRPGGNVTGVNQLSNALGAKRLELAVALVPGTKRIALLVNPINANAEPVAADLQSAVRARGTRLDVLAASNEREIDTVFEKLAGDRPDILVVSPDPLFLNRRDQIAALTIHDAVSTIFPWRDYVTAGGLISYGTSLREVYRQAGEYAGRILKGAKPAELPVVQPTKFELVINLKTAKALGLEIPPTLLALADEVIE